MRLPMGIGRYFTGSNFPPVWGTEQLLNLQFMPLSLSLSLSLSQVNQSQWDFVGLSELKACFIRVL